MDGRRIRPLFLPLHPRRNRYTPSSSLQTPYPALRRKRQSLVIPLQLLSEHDPLCWARVRAKDVGRQTMDVRRETLEFIPAGRGDLGRTRIWTFYTMPSTLLVGRRLAENCSPSSLRGTRDGAAAARNAQGRRLLLRRTPRGTGDVGRALPLRGTRRGRGTRDGGCRCAGRARDEKRQTFFGSG